MRTPITVGAVAVLATSLAWGQDDRCIFRIEHIGNQGTTQETPTGTNYFAGGGVRLFCQGTTIRMASDSVASFDGGAITYFIGNVRYRDSAMTLDADRGTWFQEGARWEARGNVHTRNLENGSTLTGPHLDYFRAQEGIRAQESMYAVGRPRIEYAVTDSAGASEEPYVIVADRVRMTGDDRIWAGGNVTIDRSDFSGKSDSLWLDSGTEGKGALIDGRPVIRGTGENPYSLSGERIDLELEQKDLRRVIAQDSAHAVNDEWDLIGDTVVVGLVNQEPDRIDAWGSIIRPLAQSESYRVAADSVTLNFPGAQLSDLHAIGAARLETSTDSLTGEADWIAGDTVVATFLASDSTGSGENALERLIARSQAQSFRQIRPEGVPGARPSLNYVVGDIITITMKPPPGEGVDRVDVEGQVQGVQLEPVAGAPVEPVAPTEGDDPAPPSEKGP